MARDDKDEKDSYVFSKETKFTQLVQKNKSDRRKYQEDKGKKLLDRSREAPDEDNLEYFEKVSLYDKSTELLNQKTFMRKLEYELKRAKRYKRPLSLLVLEIDSLDEYSKQHGSMIVEDMLRATAKIIQEAIRDVDVAGRIANNVLAVVFPETYSSRAVVVGERIRERMKAKPINKQVSNIRPTVSIGVVSFPTHARDEIDLLEKSREFVNIAKQEGGDRVYNG